MTSNKFYALYLKFPEYTLEQKEVTVEEMLECPDWEHVYTELEKRNGRIFVGHDSGVVYYGFCPRETQRIVAELTDKKYYMRRITTPSLFSEASYKSSIYPAVSILDIMRVNKSIHSLADVKDNENKTFLDSVEVSAYRYSMDLDQLEAAKFEFLTDFPT